MRLVRTAYLQNLPVYDPERPEHNPVDRGEPHADPGDAPELNCQVYSEFYGGELIVCADFAADYAIQALEGKPDMARYATPESVERHFDLPLLRKAIPEFLENAPWRRMVTGESFGSAIVDRFKNMLLDGSKRAVFILTSGKHLMTLVLERGDEEFAAHFFESNSCKESHCRLRDYRDFEGQHLASYFNGSFNDSPHGIYEFCVPYEVALMFQCAYGVREPAPVHGVKEIEPSGAALYLLMDAKAPEVSLMARELVALGDEALREALIAPVGWPSGKHCGHVAMSDPEKMEHWVALLQRLPAPMRSMCALIETVDENGEGDTPLGAALRDAKAETVAKFATVLDLLPEHDRPLAVLGADFRNFERALEVGDPTLAAWFRLLDSLPSSRIRWPQSALDASFAKTMKSQDPARIAGFHALLRRMPAQQRYETILHRQGERMEELRGLFIGGKSEAMKAWVEMVADLVPDAQLLQHAIDFPKGSEPGSLFMTMAQGDEGRAGTWHAFAQLFAGRGSREFVARLLRDAVDGKSALVRGMASDLSGKKVSMLADLIVELLPPTQAEALLSGCDSPAWSAVNEALARHNAAALRTWAAAVKRLPPASQVKILGDAAPETSGPVLSSKRATVLWEQLLDTFPATVRRQVTERTVDSGTEEDTPDADLAATSYSYKLDSDSDD